MVHRASILLETATSFGIMLVYGFAACFGLVGALVACSLVLRPWRKKRHIAVCLALCASGAVTSVLVISGIFSYQFLFEEHIIKDVEPVIHMSLFTGLFVTFGWLFLDWLGRKKGFRVRYKDLEVAYIEREQNEQ